MRCAVDPKSKTASASPSRATALSRPDGHVTSPLQAAADRSAYVSRLAAIQRVADGSQPVLQRYDLTAPTTKPRWRISDTRKSAVPQDSSEGGKSLYATSDIITDGDAKLLAASSAIGLRQTDVSMDYEGHTVYKVAPYLRDQAIADTDHDQTKKIKRINAGEQADDTGVTDDKMLALWTDCGKAARTIMGIEGTPDSPKATTAIGDSKAGGNPVEYSKKLFPKAIKAFFGSNASEGYLKKGVHYRSVLGFTWFITPWSAKSAKRMYYELGEEGRDAFDRHVGINRYVNPEIGDAYTMVTEHDMPGFKSSGKTWNFHWAGVVAKDGADNLTLEGYAVDAGPLIQDAKEKMSGKALTAEIKRLKKYAAEYVDRDWLFQMYGTDAGKTFHDDHLGSGTHGNRATTFHAKK